MSTMTIFCRAWSIAMTMMMKNRNVHRRTKKTTMIPANGKGIIDNDDIVIIVINDHHTFAGVVVAVVLAVDDLRRIIAKCAARGFINSQLLQPRPPFRLEMSSQQLHRRKTLVTSMSRFLIRKTSANSPPILLS